jgi:2,3-bisphosphoglycerate-independent phosphoglycerate mutase
MSNPVALIILDGWGISNSKEHNAIMTAKILNFDKYSKKYASTTIKASGLDVGLPDGQMGNSEVGHLNIGAGRVVYQHLTNITKEISEGNFYKNEEFLKACKNVKENGTNLHIMGLLSDGGVHSHINHIKGLVQLAKKNNVKKLYLHAFLDGRDTPPKSACKYVEEIEKEMKEVGVGEIATIGGRYYSMDRDNRWDRIELGYNVLFNAKGEKAQSAIEAIENSYKKDEADEFVKPTVIIKNGKPIATIKENDSIIFFNFRPDRARQITRAIVDKNFKKFERDYIKTVFVSMTTYDETLEGVDVAYKPTKLVNTLGEYLSDNGKKQLRIAETEKYAHITFFFNGGIEAPNKNEDRVLINSPNVATYDMKPEMSAYEVTDALIKQIDLEKHDFIVLNFANTDMVGHTGDFNAAVKAVEAVDECLGRVVEKLLSKNGKVIITADHGNAELMEDEDGNPMTAHTTNVVPCIVVDGDVKLRNDGKLCDLAPTLLELMEMDKPVEMTGISLIENEEE